MTEPPSDQQLFRGVFLNKAAKARLPICVAVAWLPLFVLSALQGRLFVPQLSFFHDFAVHVRLLLSLPLLILAESAIDPRVRSVLAFFDSEDLLPREEREHFCSAVRGFQRGESSVLVRTAIVVTLVLLAILRFRGVSTEGVLPWLSRPEDPTRYSLAGLWYLAVSVPIFQLFLISWLFRLLNWGVLLVRMAKIHWRLSPAHPDRAGGLSILNLALIPFFIVVFAISANVCALIGRAVVYQGMPLTDSVRPLVALWFVELVIFLGPLLAFVPRLIRLRRSGLFAYGGLGTAYAGLFDRKWTERRLDFEANERKGLLGTGDIQSLSDLHNAYEVVSTLRLHPIEKRSLIGLTAAAFVPALPLLFIQIPLAEFLKQAVKLVLR